MMIKIVGALITITSCTVAGFLWANNYANRTRQIRELQNALTYMETEILYGHTPLDAILNSISLRVKEPLASLFKQISEELVHGNSTIQESWSNAIQRYWRVTSMKENEREILLQLGNNLGLSDASNQQKHIRVALNHLQAEEMDALDQQKRYEKMTRILGFLIGVLIVIIVI
jgi:stage III sporulation protein AB